MSGMNQLKEAMSKFATGITVVTSLEDGGKPHGMTANAFTSVSLDPPLILICIAHARNTYRYVKKQEIFGINILAGDQKSLAEYWSINASERTMDIPVSWTFTGHGVPVIDGCVCFLGCRVAGAHDYGDHTIFVGHVEDIQIHPGSPLIFFDRKILSFDS